MAHTWNQSEGQCGWSAEQVGRSEVTLGMGVGTMPGMWLQATGKGLTEKMRLEIKKGEGTIAIGSS